MSGRDYQLAVLPVLERHFDDVRLEWSIPRGATDRFAPNATVYAPRVDIAVGPFSLEPGRSAAIDAELLPPRLRGLFEGRPANANPRCLLAIEVYFSGSSKHIMGDMLNAGALGLYGLIVGADEHMAKIRRIGRYVEILGDLGKMPWLFRNVVALSATEFDALIR